MESNLDTDMGERIAAALGYAYAWASTMRRLGQEVLLPECDEANCASPNYAPCLAVLMGDLKDYAAGFAAVIDGFETWPEAVRPSGDHVCSRLRSLAGHAPNAVRAASDIEGRIVALLPEPFVPDTIADPARLLPIVQDIRRTFLRTNFAPKVDDVIFPALHGVADEAGVRPVPNAEQANLLHLLGVAHLHEHDLIAERDGYVDDLPTERVKEAVMDMRAAKSTESFGIASIVDHYGYALLYPFANELDSILLYEAELAEEKILQEMAADPLGLARRVRELEREIAALKKRQHTETTDPFGFLDYSGFEPLDTGSAEPADFGNFGEEPEAEVVAPPPVKESVLSKGGGLFRRRRRWV